MRALAYGDRALLLDLDDGEEPVGWAAAIAEADLGALDIVPGARTVLVTACTPEQLGRIREALGGLTPRDTEADEDREPVEIPTVYDGPDLDEVCRLTGLSRDEVIAAHTGRPWTVAFGGFAPGFAYLTGGDERLEVPRRDDPRTAVPAGSVGLAGTFSGAYPRESPGGWQLIGCTDATLFDLDRDPPALLQPGDRVRFVEVGR
ncbi:5-oxoprolinase subunit PxpB [Aeromicrobium sp. YIM 150415]|uniref:5-oxoprolinase subunit PxpB n=1 Tax=Aeromicrobium sp. YIM 150415 TaxID=2803912 RepID=UPI0019625600|nr:5-oxoprolinase subunit PxpB [Aeromicrobium sp. YIM 150415]MBM9465448.1 5-oxoprolinase subunit PxpB [Aeromicrobium sp. YIM 150415]